MNLRIRVTRTRLAAVTGALLAVGCGLLLHEFPLGRGLTQSSYDLLMVERGDIRAEEAVIIYMDEKSHSELQQSFTAAWDRSLHARLIDRLTSAGARAVVFDVTFTDPDPNKPSADEALANAMKKSGHVILAVDYVRAGANANKVDPPFDLVRNAAVGFGSDELMPDADLVVRQHTKRGDAPISSLSWMAAEHCGAKVTSQENLEDSQRWINYYGSPNYLPWKSYVDALDPTIVSDEFFRGKAVFVGARILTKFA